MSAAATVAGGGIASGSIVAVCQSMGALGTTGISYTSALLGTGTTVAAAEAYRGGWLTGWREKKEKKEMVQSRL